MKRKICVLLLLSMAGLVSAQEVKFYSDMYLKPEMVQTGPYKGWQLFTLGNMVFYNDRGKNSLHLKVISKREGKEILNFNESDEKVKRYELKFFSAGDDLPVMMMLDLHGRYSWGNYVFWIEEGSITKCGFIGLGVDNFNFSSLSLYAEFSYSNQEMTLEFRNDVSLIDYDNDKLIPAQQISFVVKKDELKRLEN